jgi:transcriptional regulator with XRE-family HTH domain
MRYVDCMGRGNASAQLIREARLRAGLTQAELAHRIGTTQSSVARWEAGRTRPSIETLTEIVSACGLEVRIWLVPADPDEASLIERNLALSPEERLDQLRRVVSFVQAGRSALMRRLG